MKSEKIFENEKRKAKAEKIIEKLKAKSKIFNFENCKRKAKAEIYDFAFQLWRQYMQHGPLRSWRKQILRFCGEEIEQSAGFKMKKIQSLMLSPAGRTVLSEYPPQYKKKVFKHFYGAYLFSYLESTTTY